MIQQNTPRERPALVLALACAANFITILDLWVVSIAYPAFERAFAPATLADVSWILNAYAISLAAFLVPAGRSADSVGRKRWFLAGLLLFGAASLACGLAPSLPLLVVARALQGLAAAMLMPSSLGLALSAFPAERRSTAVGIWSACSAAAACGGPPLGGLLLELSWRWLFFINVPLIGAALLLGARYLSGPAAALGARRRLDLQGTLLVLGSTALVCTALVQADAWRPEATTLAFALGILLALALVRHVRRHTDPIVLPELFALPRFRQGLIGISVYYVGFAVLLVGTTLLLTERWQLSVLDAALAIAPGPCMATVLAPFAGRLTARFGARRLLLGGAACFAAAGAIPLWTAGDTANYAASVLPSMLCWGVANALLQPALFASADAAPAAELASASAVLTMARQLASAIGVALFVAVVKAQHGAGLAGIRGAWLIVVASGALVGWNAYHGAEWRAARLEAARAAE